ncbi:MAG: reverse transcriptase domain-containing protein, partial [Nitrospirota bacterium]
MRRSTSLMTSGENCGIRTDARPIGISLLFWRLLTASILRMETPTLPTWQRGIGSRGAAKKIVHTIRLAHSTGKHVLLLDVKNAFNSLSRVAILRSVARRKKEFPLLYMAVRMALIEPSKIYFQFGEKWTTIIQTMGVAQGDPSSVCGFSEALGDAIPANKIVSEIFEAFLDDMNAADRSIDTIIQLLVEIETALAKINLELNYNKCELLLAHAIPEDKLEWFRAKGIGTDAKAVKCLGAWIGNPQVVDRELQVHLHSSLDALSTLERLAAVDAKTALAIARFCVWPRLLYRFETHPPATTVAIAQAFDSQVVRFASAVVGTPITASTVFSPDGLGFTQYADKLVSLYAVTPPSAPHQPSSSLRRFGASVTPWMSTFAPNTATLADFLLLLKMKLALSVFTPGTRCFCGISCPPNNTSAFSRHVLSCMRVKGWTATHRHNAITSALAHIIESFGFLVSVEPRFFAYEDGSAKRPDLTVHLGPHMVTTDVTVVEDEESAATSKSAKHAKACEMKNSRFVPFVINTDGSHHATCNQFLTEVAKGLPRSTATLFRLMAIKATSEAWVTGTAGIIRSVQALQAGVFSGEHHSSILNAHIADQLTDEALSGVT